MLRHIKQISMRRLFPVVVIGYMGNNVYPARAGEVLRSYILKRREAVPVPIKRGGVLFMQRRTMHSALENVSDDIRWSFDLRYQPIGQPTGRPFFPSLVVRSYQDPAGVVTDWQVWRDLWRATRVHLSQNPHTGSTNRWTGKEMVCA